MSKNRKFRILCLILSIMMLFMIIITESVENMAYEAEESAYTSLESTKEVTVDDRAEYIVFEPAGDFYNKGIIFYPGGSVDEESYAPLMHAIAEEGYLCILARMPFKVAVMDVNKADAVRKDFPRIADWYLAGHSLGGAMAAIYAHENASQIKGVILLAAYSTVDLKEDALEVLSIYGSADEVLNMENYIEYKENLPVDMTEMVISGGNHAYFGNYGEQNGDGSATLSAEEQQKITVETICEFLE